MSKDFVLPKKKVDYAIFDHLWLRKDKINFDEKLFNETYCEVNNVDCTIIAIFNKDFDLCKKLPRDSSGFPHDPVRRCIFYTALWNDFEFSDCDKLGIDYKECYQGTILNRRDSDLCEEKLDIQKEQSSCLYEMALNTHGRYDSEDILLCDRTHNRNHCVEEIFNPNKEKYEKSNDPRICKLLFETGQFRVFGNKCFYNLAIENLDITLCEQIEEGNPLRDDCKERVQHTLKIS